LAAAAATDAPAVLAEDKASAAGQISGDVFGRAGHYVHPFVSGGYSYNDNITNTRDNPESDTAWHVTPGIWLAVPGVKGEYAGISTSSFTPGGLAFDFERPAAFRRYQAYLLAGADLQRYLDHPEEDTTDSKVEGLFQYNFRGGLSANLADQYYNGHDVRGTGISTELDKFTTNLATLVLTYDLSSKFALRADLGNFDVNYDGARNDYRDREDNALATYLYYKYSAKTALFLEYLFLDIAYDQDYGLDSREHHVYGGLRWKLSDKSRGTLQAGWVDKTFAAPGAGSQGEFSVSLSGSHNLSSKTSLSVSAARRLVEPDMPGASFSLSHSLSAGLNQQLTGKISGSLSVSYTSQDYDSLLRYGAEMQQRSDKIYSLSPGVSYRLTRWLAARLSCSYTERDSNFDEFDYTGKSVMLSLGMEM